MYAPAASARLPARILHLARREPSVRTDAMVLRSLDACAVTFASGGKDALALLEKGLLSEAGVLVCGEQPADMPLVSFLRMLAAHPSLRTTPVVVLAASEAAAQTLRTAGVQTLTRPYAADDLARALNKALSPLRRPLDKTVLDDLAARSRPSSGAVAPSGARLTLPDLYSRACEHLRRKALGPAEADFREVLRRQEDHPEACLGLARLYRERNDARSMRRFLLRAAAAALRRREGERARAIAAHLPEQMRGVNLYMYEALARLEEGDAQGAARSFLDLCQALPGARLHTVLARACQLTENPEDNLRRLCAAFASLGRINTAGKLRQRLLYSVEPRVEEEGPSWLDRFPRLKEIAGVASSTARAWRRAG
jgi:CheY-like chemotaxis protein